MVITVIGCGRWGSFIARYLAEIGHRVTLYGRPGSRHMERLLRERKNDYMTLPEEVTLSVDPGCITGGEAVVISIGAQGLRGLCRQIRPLLAPGVPLILCMKGLESGTGKRLTEIAAEELGPERPTAVWLGPGHVQDFLQGIPNCMVLDSADAGLTARLVDAFSGGLIRFYYGTDLIGSEVGAAAKNVVGIAAGMLDGLSLSSLKGALMTRGTREIARLIQALGGNERSAYGLCHLGDYEATVFSPHSHNRRYGESVVRGEAYGHLAEGAYTVDALTLLADREGVELPICSAVGRILRDGADPRETVSELFLRSLKKEF